MSRALHPLVALSLLAGPLAAQRADTTDWHIRYTALAAQSALPDSVRLHRLFDLDWDRSNIESPEGATFNGYPGQNDRWTDMSPTAIARRKAEADDPLLVLATIRRNALDSADQLNYDLFRYNGEMSVQGNRFPTEYLAISQMGGPQYLADVLTLAPAATPTDYRDLLARLHALPTVVDQTIALLRRGVAAGVTQPRVVLRAVPDQITALVPDSALASPLLEPFTRVPAGFSAALRDSLRAAAVADYQSRVRPAYQTLRDYLVRDYIPHARQSIAADSLPDGAAWYAYDVRRETTTDRTPAQIHQLGLAEVARIRHEMDSLIAATGFHGSFQDFTTFLRTDPRFFYTDSASLVRAYRDIAKRIDPQLAHLFGTLPRLPYGVTTIPSYAAPSQTTAYYQPGAPDVGRPGWYYVNTYKLDTRPTWEMEALTAHESVPGHHLQIALAQELPHVPAFRRYGGYTAFVEGWALYSEGLGPELGLYRDPYSKFGQLTYEMWRAVRLVLDTGIHSMGWNRQQAIDYFEANSAKTQNDITVEVDRYITWPGQALAYKSGELKIRELRSWAEAQLGPRFDIRQFHDVVLGAGALPLGLLDTRVHDWVAAQLASTPPRT